MKEIRKINNQNGAAMVEFAIVLPVLLMLIFGMIELSILLYDKAMITNASREGTRLGILYRPNPVLEEDITNTVDSYLQNNLISLGNGSANWTTTVSGQCSYTGAPLTVTVTYPYNFLVLPNFVQSLSGTLTLSAQTVMRCE